MDSGHVNAFDKFQQFKISHRVNPKLMWLFHRLGALGEAATQELRSLPEARQSLFAKWSLHPGTPHTAQGPLWQDFAGIYIYQQCAN